MTLEEFRKSMHSPGPPPLSAPLRALWHDAAGDWNAAHEAVQDEESTDAAWVHAYLHRKEGDAGNARYWYARAGRDFADVPFPTEWEAITTALLAGES